MPAEGEDARLVKRGKVAEYVDYFSAPYKEKRGWKRDEIIDLELKTGASLVLPFLHPSQPHRIFTKQAFVLLDAFNGEKKIDWAPMLLLA